MNVLNCVFAGIGALSAVAIGISTVFISRAQLKISKHKKDDFLYDKRFQIYEELRDVMLKANSELWALNNKEIPCIDSQFVCPLYNKISSLISDANLLFEDEKIYQFICEVRFDIAHLFGVNGVELVDDESKLKILNKWNEQMASGYITHLFEKYLKLV